MRALGMVLITIGLYFAINHKALNSIRRSLAKGNSKGKNKPFIFIGILLTLIGIGIVIGDR